MKEIIIIDGNNLLRKSNIKGSGEDDRLTLYEKVKSRLGLHQKCIFFFDGYGESSKDDIIFSYDKTADELMKNYIEKKLLERSNHSYQHRSWNNGVRRSMQLQNKIIGKILG